MSASNSEGDHAGDLSSAQEPILFLSLLFFQYLNVLEINTTLN